MFGCFFYFCGLWIKGVWHLIFHGGDHSGLGRGLSHSFAKEKMKNIFLWALRENLRLALHLQNLKWGTVCSFFPLSANHVFNGTLYCTILVCIFALITLPNKNFPDISSERSYVELNKPCYFYDDHSRRENHTLQTPYRNLLGRKKVQNQTDGKNLPLSLLDFLINSLIVVPLLQ